MFSSFSCLTPGITVVTTDIPNPAALCYHLCKMELIVQKAVELGACEIIPVAMVRSVVKLDSKKAASKVKRWQMIAEA